MSVRKKLPVLIIAGAILAAGSSSALWFITDMYDQISVKPQEGDPRQLPEGSVPTVGNLPPGAISFGERLAKLDPSLPQDNPVPASDESLASGKEMYETYCYSCHGKTGLGDGPVALRGAGIPPFPLIGTINARSDGYIFGQIWAGGAIMGPYYTSLEPDEVWDIINYLRSLNSQ